MNLKRSAAAVVAAVVIALSVTGCQSLGTVTGKRNSSEMLVCDTDSCTWVKVNPKVYNAHDIGDDYYVIAP